MVTEIIRKHSQNLMGVLLTLLMVTMATSGYFLRHEFESFRATMNRLDTTLTLVKEEMARTKMAYTFCHERLQLHEARLLKLEEKAHNK